MPDTTNNKIKFSNFWQLQKIKEYINKDKYHVFMSPICKTAFTGQLITIGASCGGNTE
jgi:hypothetical protein